jgi:galactokinase
MPGRSPEPSAEVTTLFARAFGGEPTVVASAPGRVNLIGEHTDYNGGEVLPIGIAHRTWVAMRAGPRGAPTRAVSANATNVGEWESPSTAPTGEWWDYISGVALAFGQSSALPPLQIAVASDVPSGAGLSSSAALEVATTTALATLLRIDMPKRDAALLSHRVETEYVGVACGMMDQFASALAEDGQALHLHCDTGAIDYVPMHEAVLIFDTGAPRALRTSEFNTRRAECEQAFELLQATNPALQSLAQATPDEVRAAKLPAPLDRRAMHVSEETRRVQRTVDALRATGSIPGDILYESHESLRVLYDCSTPQLDWFVRRASSASGVRGARLTGAGWGGCAIAVGSPNGLGDLARVIVDEYQSQFGLVARTWITRASAGACVDYARVDDESASAKRVAR